MAGEDAQAEKRRAQDAAFRAWENRPRDAGREETDRLWEAMWTAADFSWDGLADAGWELGSRASQAQKLKRWRAPADFPGRGKVSGEGETAWKEATLQDYWRWSIGIVGGKPRLLTDRDLITKGLLVSFNGGLWHILHRPKAEAYDGPAGESLAEALLARFEATTGYTGEERPEGRLLMPGGRARNLAAVWRAFSGAHDPTDRKPLHLTAALARFDEFDASALTFGDWACFHNAAFGDRARFEGAAFGDNLEFSNATFGNGAWFSGAAFGEGVWFDGATFGEDVRFDQTTFGNLAWFERATFGNRARFVNAAFGDAASFSEATFGDRAWFLRAAFADHARFEGAEFGDLARFDGAVFGDRAWFNGAKFGDAVRFAESTFGKEAQFEGAVFGDLAWFDEVAFGDDAMISRATFGHDASFTGGVFGDRAWFDRARFEGNVSFDGVSFGTSARFDQTRFARRANFHAQARTSQPTFAGPVTFKSAQFEGPVLFGDSSTFPGADFAGRVSFRAATFEDYADFSRCTWPARAEDSQGAFEGARFRDVADFNTDAFDAFALFDGAGFERPIRFADPQSETPEDGFKRAVTATEDAVKRDDAAVAAAQSEDERKALDRDRPPHERGADARWAALSGGLRTLKLAMEAQSDQDRQQRFYRFELRARLRRPSTPWWERRIAGPLYWASSDYGTSIAWPLAALLGLIAAFAAVYWAIAALAGAGLGPAAPIDFALSQSVRPFGVWWGPAMPDIPPLPGQPGASLAERLEAAPWRVQLAHALGQAGWTGVKVIATVQSFFSIILLFLFALAVRRRFQIS